MTVLLVCSPGGHLRQMWMLRPRLALGEDVLWAVTPTGQSQSLLRDERTVDLPHTASRDYREALGLFRMARRVLREENVTRVISTGALPAVPFFAQARALRLPCHYIESAARYDGPSMSGRLISAIPGVEIFAQYPVWAGGRWRFAGSVLDGYAPAPGHGNETAPIRRAVVTLGVEAFGFRRAVDRILQVLPPDAEVLWQTGHTDVSDLQLPHQAFLPGAELQSAMEQADVVIAHSGTGSALTAMAVGKHPVLLPRRAAFGEHVDDHQYQIAAELHRRGVATWRDVDDLDLQVLQTAAAASVRYTEPPRFPLKGVG